MASLAFGFHDNLIMLEAEIVELETRIVALKRKRNFCVPLCRLPDEITVLILHHARRPLDQPVERDRMSRPSYLGFFVLPGFCDFLYDRTWLRSTAVCSSIRDIALNTPALWSYIDVGAHKELLALHISRALGIPLVMNLDNRKDRVIATTEHLTIANAVRVCDGEDVSRLLDVSQKLKTLHVTGVKHEHQMHALSQIAPHLEELYLLGMLAPAVLQGWTNLRRLCLDSMIIKLGTMHSLLRKMHSLEELTVIDAIYGTLYEADADQRPISEHFASSPCLQKLKQITVVMDFFPTLVLLQCIAGLRHSTHDIALHLDKDDPDRWTVVEREEDVIPLVEHLLEVWNGVWTHAHVLSATLEWHRYDLKDSLDARITATGQGGDPSRQSRLLIPYSQNPDVRALYPRYGVAFTSLSVYATADIGPNTINQLEELIAANAPHLQSIRFYGISAAKEVRQWFTPQLLESTVEPKDIGLLDVKDVRFIDCDKEGEASKQLPWEGTNEDGHDEGHNSDDEDTNVWDNLTEDEND
jgi:hypothetical protein